MSEFEPTEVERGEVTWDASREDVHMNLEATLTERIGAAGAKLHTGRSRNDQVATDMRLWTRRACAATEARLDRLLCVLATRAAGCVDVLMPGYTHLQRAQPVRLAHHLLAWAEMLDRDRGRLAVAVEDYWSGTQIVVAAWESWAAGEVSAERTASAAPTPALWSTAMAPLDDGWVLFGEDDEGALWAVIF